MVNKNPAERPYLPPTEKNNKGWKRLAWRRKQPSQGDHHLGCPLCSTQQPPPSRAVPLSNGPQWQSQGVAATKKSGQAHRSSGKTYTVPEVLRTCMDTRKGTVIISHGIPTFPPSFLGSHHPSSMSPPHHPMQFNAIDPVHVNSGFQLLGSYSIAILRDPLLSSLTICTYSMMCLLARHDHHRHQLSLYAVRSFQRVPVCPLFSLARGRPWSTVHWGATGLGLRNRLEPFAMRHPSMLHCMRRYGKQSTLFLGLHCIG